jgi:3-methyl-2-oxobutanoate hydroxymethyltransferase
MADTAADSAAGARQADTKPMTVPRFQAAKAPKRRLTMITAYDFLWAGLFDAAGVDSLLVGDTLGMVVQGKSTTLPVTLDEIIYHTEMVARAARRALVIADMPFMTFQESPRKAVRNAGRILKEAGAAAVKLEGGVNQADTIAALAAADVPVVAHIGMKPQSVRKLGSMGKIQRGERQLLADARAAQDAGAFAIVLELIPQQTAQVITKELSIPTIGIGAGPHCDGQVLVSQDMLGLTEGFRPKFLKQYADLRAIAAAAVEQYVREVQDATFPGPEHSHD